MNFRSFSTWLASLGFGSMVAVAAGCGDDAADGSSTTQGTGAATTGGQGGSTTGGMGGAGNAGLGGSGPDNCPEGQDYTDAADVWASETVTANLIRIDGAPAANVLTQLCGIDACYAIDDTDAAGAVLLDNGDPTDLDTPAFKIGDGLLYGKVAYVLPDGVLDHAYPDTRAIEMTDSGAAFPMGGDVTAVGVTLRIPEGGVALVDELFFPDPPQQTFRAVVVPAAMIDEVAGAAQGFGALVGLGPIDTHLCPAAELTIPNTAGWEAGAAVEFLLHGTEVGEEFAPYGGWARVSTGAVSAAGDTITTTAGEGIPVLGVVGVRLIP